MNFSGYVGHATIFFWTFTNACCSTVGLSTWLKNKVWLVSGYAHVFIPLSVVIVTLPMRRDLFSSAACGLCRQSAYRTVAWKQGMVTDLPELTSQTQTVWSKEPVMSCDPVVLKLRVIISAVCPCQQINTSVNLSCSLPSFAFLATPIPVSSGWQRGSAVRTLVFGCQTFTNLCLIYGWHVTTSSVRCQLWVSQPGQINLPSLRSR